MKVKLPNFSITKGQLPPELTGGSRLRSLARRIRSMGVWLGVGAGFFLLFTWLSIPTRAIAWRIGHEAKKAGYVVDIEDISVWPWGTITLENVQWTFEPSRAGQIPGKFVLEEVDVDIGLFSLMAGNLDVEIEAEREEGRIRARYQRDEEVTKVEFDVEELPLYDVPKARQALNVPLMGLFGFEVELEVPQNEYSKAKGFVEISCSGCRLGDDETKLYVPGSKGLKNGVTIPEIDLGSLSGRMEIEEGKGEIVETIETESEDLAVAISGSIRLHDKIQLSGMDIVIKADFSDALQERSEKIRLMVQTANPKVKLDPPERGLGWRLEGVFGKPRFKGIKSKSRRQRLEERRERQRNRDARRARRDAKRKADKRKKEQEKKKKEEKEEEKEEEEEPKADRNDASGDRDDEERPGNSGNQLDIEPLEPDDGDEPGDDPPALPPAVSDDGSGRGSDEDAQGSGDAGQDPSQGDSDGNESPRAPM